MTREHLRLVAEHARPHRARLALVALLMLLQALAALAVPLLAGELSKDLLGDATARFELDTIFVLVLTVLAMQALLSIGHQRIAARTYTKVGLALRVQLYDHLQALALSDLDDRRRGDVVTLIDRDCEQIAEIIDASTSVVPTLASFGGAAGMMILIDPFYGAIATATVPIYVLLTRLLGRRLGQLSSQAASARAEANATADEQLGQLLLLKVFTREGLMSARYRDLETRAHDLNNRLYFTTASLYPVVQLATAFGVIALMWSMSGRVAAGDLAPAAFVTFLLYGLLVTGPMGRLASLYGAAMRARGSVSRIHEALALDVEQLDDGADLPELRGAIRLEGIHFAYRGREPVFRGLDLTIAKDELLVITGPNGSGKSTLSKLLLGLVAPQQGRITWDDVDLSDVSLKSLRDNIAFVPQQTTLFDLSARDNIAVAAEGVSDEDVVAAARAAGAHDFIEQLPDGYDTPVGVDGVKLSGGQRQRIALARALLKEAPVLLLDEPTSMLDRDATRSFLDHVASLSNGRTVVLICHEMPDLAVPHRTVSFDDVGHGGAPSTRDESAIRRRSAR